MPFCSFRTLITTAVFTKATYWTGCQSQKQEVWHQTQTVAIEVKQYLLSFLCTMIPGFKPEITELNSRSLPLSDRQEGCLYMEGVAGFSWLRSRPQQGGETRPMSCPLRAAMFLSTVWKKHWPSAESRPSALLPLNVTHRQCEYSERWPSSPNTLSP